MKPELHKRLVAIMFTDMVGYTAMMQQDEKTALQKRKRHREVFEQQHQQFHGEIIQYFGDGTLSIFSNSYDAVGCAVAMQKALQAPVRVPLRIGIHTGNVMSDKDALIGDAVNIASRIESFSPVNGVLISDMVQDQLKNQTQWKFVTLGKFQLKNVERPFELYAVSAEGLVVPDAHFLQGKGQKMATLKGRLPVPATPILGREKETTALIRLIHTNQVITITGPGGMGKTRLSVEIGNQLKSEFQDGIAFISLSTLTDAAEVMPRIATTLDIKDAQGRKPIEGIVALISDKKALLILDNLEQVIEAAQDIADLAAQCPHLKILCTSRTPLKIKAEQEYALHPLPLPSGPDIDTLMHYPAIELFVSRAQKANPDFMLTGDNAKTVVEICRRIDGLPLALELAAARIRILPPGTLLTRLSQALNVLTTGPKDLPIRHQTLRATIGWSHSLLKEAEQRLFRRLAVFAGGFTLEAIEKVCYEEEEAAYDALDELESMVDKGLVENVEGGHRFSLLQTIKDFALEQLKAAGETDLLFQQHAAYYYELSQKINEGMQGGQQIAYIRQGVREMANFQAALDYLLKQAKAGDEKARETGMDMCGELSMFWHIRGYNVSIRNYVHALLETADLEKPSLGKCKAIGTLGGIYWTLGDFEQGKKYSIQYYAIAEQLNHTIELLKAGTFLSFVYIFSDITLAKKYSDAAVARARETNIDYWLAWTLWSNGLLHLTNSDFTKAKERLLEAYELIKRLGENEVKGTVISSLAMLAVIEGEQDTAIELLHQSLGVFEAVGSRPEEARVLNELSWVYLEKRHTEVARKYFLGSIQAYREVGSMRGVGSSVLGLASIEAVQGRAQKAIEMAAAAEHFAAQEGIVNRMYADTNLGALYIDPARKELSGVDIENAEKAGRALSLKEVLQMAEDQPVWVEQKML